MFTNIIIQISYKQCTTPHFKHRLWRFKPQIWCM